MNARKLQRKAAQRAKRQERLEMLAANRAEMQALNPKATVVLGTPPGMRRKRKEHGGGNAVRKTMKVVRRAKDDWIAEQGFDPARLKKGPTGGLDFPEVSAQTTPTT